MIIAIALGCFAASAAFAFAVSALDTGRLDRDGDGRVQTMIVGDSLAAAFFATTEDAGFAHLVQNDVGPVELTETARAHQTLATVAGVTTVPSGLEVAVVELGTNDVGMQTPLEEFRAQYADLTHAIRASSPRVRMVCLGTWTGWGDDYDQVIEDACNQFDGVYVDAQGLFTDPGNRGPAGLPTFVGDSDDFHPNDQGHRAIADAVVAALQPAG